MAIADVDAVIAGLAAIDLHARHNTTSVYTAATIFPMLPEKLSTDITSLGQAADRQAIVVEMVVAADGSVQQPAIYRAWVRNQAKLAYNSVAAWLEGGPAPAAVAAVPGLEENLRLQDKAAQALKGLRQLHGALTFETLQGRAKFEGDEVRDVGGRKAQSGHATHRRFHGGRQRRDRRVPGAEEVPLPAAAWSARPNAGIGSSRSPSSMAANCRPSPTRGP